VAAYSGPGLPSPATSQRSSGIAGLTSDRASN
jgi:hypothetical protein